MALIINSVHYDGTQIQMLRLDHSMEQQLDLRKSSIYLEIFKNYSKKVLQLIPASDRTLSLSLFLSLLSFIANQAYNK